MSDYYVYAHYDDSGMVLYIGKGRGNRAWKSSEKDRSVYWHRHVNKYCVSEKPEVRIWVSGLTEEQALASESEWIAIYGRRWAFLEKETGNVC